MKKLQYQDMKLTSEQEFYLKSIATSKWQKNRDENMTQIWFETFLEHIGQIGLKVVQSNDEYYAQVETGDPKRDEKS